MRALSVMTWVVVMAGCASSSGTSPGVASRSANLITREEIEAQLTTQESAYQLIQRLHPNWLRARTSSFSGERILPAVVLNGSRYGELDSLRDFRIGDLHVGD